MNRKQFLIAVTALISVPSLAQVSNDGTPVLSRSGFSGARPHRTSEISKYPLLTDRLSVSDRSTSLQPAGTFEGGVIINRAPQQASSARLLGNLIYEDDWKSRNITNYSYAELLTGDTLKLNPLYTVTGNITNFGAAYVDGHIYTVYGNASSIANHTDNPHLYEINTNPWRMVRDNVEISNYSLMAIETASAPDGTVYGEFYSSDLSYKEFGIIDYRTLTRTTISSANHIYVAMGITSDNRWYGVATDGNLYQIDTHTGLETFVGPTGVENIKNSSGQYYAQSGEIDAETNTFYWNFININTRQSTLYTVDLATGKATAVGRMPKEAALSGMVIPAECIQSGVPGRAGNVSLDFNGPSTSGSLTFTAPDTTAGGSPLNGELSYCVTLNNDTLEKGKVTAGQTESVSIKDLANGYASFGITTSNKVGRSPKATIARWIGYDNPTAVTSVPVTITSNRARIRYRAPKSTVHGGYMGTDITYDVYRIAGVDTVQIASDTTATTIYDQLGSELGIYQYGIVVNNHGMLSPMAFSTTRKNGSVKEVPFFDDFLTEDGFQLYTVVDGNNDGYTWLPYSTGGSYHRAHYNHSSNGASDDWLFTPPIHMKPGRTYMVSFKTKGQGTTKSFDEKMEVKFGNAATADSMKIDIMPQQTILFDTYRVFAKEVTVSADGNYFVGFHAMSDANKFGIDVDSISVDYTTDNAAPDSVTSLSAIADAAGGLTATVGFNAPSKSYDGSSLTAITSIVVSNGRRVVATINNPVPGSRQTIKDNAAANGCNLYNIVPYNSNGKGIERAISVNVGEDVPLRLNCSTVEDLTTSAHISWYPLSSIGLRKGLVNPDSTVINFYDVADDGTLGRHLATLSGRDTTYTATGIVTEVGAPTTKYWALQATNKAGSSDYAPASLVIGKPYELPMTEDFPNQAGTYQWWLRNSSTSYWGLTGLEETPNGQGYCIYFAPFKNESCYMGSFKLNIKDAHNPQLSYYYRSTPGAESYIRAMVETPDGNFYQVQNIDSKDLTGSYAWRHAKVSLSSFKNERYIRVWIGGGAYDAPARGGDKYYDVDSLELDLISVRDIYDHDLKAELSAPTSLLKGQTGTAVVTVTNTGDNTESGYEVKLYADDKVIADTLVTDSLIEAGTKDFTFNIPTSSLIKADKLQLRAEVIYTTDGNTSNNIALDTIALRSTELLPPRNLTATGINTPTVNLQWDAPENLPYTTTEDFESYDNWTLNNFGSWTSVDGKIGTAGSISSSYSCPLTDKTFAFAIFNPVAVFGANAANISSLAAHSGDKIVVALYDGKNGVGVMDADNWLISPRLSGRAQTVSFFARNQNGGGTDYPEKFDVLYSVNGTDTASFVKVGDTHTVSGGTGWQNVAFDIPDSAKYFAIHHITDKTNVFMFSIDDCTYESAGRLPVSYNVYRDGTLIGRITSGTLLTYTDEPNVNGNHNYQVTAIYYDGSESVPVSVSATTAISEVVSTLGAPADIYTLGGQLVRRNAVNAKGLQPGIYIMRGQKIVVN